MLPPKPIKTPPLPGCKTATDHVIINLDAQGSKHPTLYLKPNAWVDITNFDKVPHHIEITPHDILGIGYTRIMPDDTVRFQAKVFRGPQPEHGMIVDTTALPRFEFPIVLCPL